MSTTLQNLHVLNSGKHFFISNEEDDSITPVYFRRNCFYIVSALLFKDDQVLLVSEAKHDGRWYLPAGKVKKQETLHDACKRELFEESFVEGEPEHLFCIEGGLGGWFRFNFIVKQTGGHLKTYDERDNDTLEAKWFPISQVVNEELDLRARDIISLISNAHQWYEQDKSLKREKSLVIPNSHIGFGIRAIAVHVSAGSSVRMAVEKSSGAIPFHKLAFDYLGYVKFYFKTNGIKVESMGLIGVEHLPVDGSFDGFCLTALCEAVEIDSNINVFEWVDVGTKLSGRIKDIFEKSSFIKN